MRLLDQSGVLEQRCVSMSHWPREKKHNSLLIWIELAIWFGQFWLIVSLKRTWCVLPPKYAFTSKCRFSIDSIAVSLFGNMTVWTRRNTHNHQRGSVSEQKIQIIILILKRGPCLLLQLTQQITHQIKNNSIESVLPAYSNIWQVLNKGNHWSDQTYTKKLKMRNKPVVNAGHCHVRLLDLSSLLQIRKRSFWKYSYFKKEHLLHSSFVLNSYTGGK